MSLKDLQTALDGYRRAVDDFMAVVEKIKRGERVS